MKIHVKYLTCRTAWPLVPWSPGPATPLCKSKHKIKLPNKQSCINVTNNTSKASYEFYHNSIWELEHQAYRNAIPETCALHNHPSNKLAEEAARMMRTNFADSGGLAGSKSNDPPYCSLPSLIIPTFWQGGQNTVRVAIRSTSSW